MRRDDTAYLLDMLLAARDAVDFAAGLTFVQFEAEPPASERNSESDRDCRRGCGTD